MASIHEGLEQRLATIAPATLLEWQQVSHSRPAPAAGRFRSLGGVRIRYAVSDGGQSRFGS
jgi:hypothetical protein